MTDFSPREIVSELDRFIVGQTDAKRAVSIALRNRWRRLQLTGSLREEVLPKNILMIGPTGVGKTEIPRPLAKLAGAPFIKAQATKFTEGGYVGREGRQIIRDLGEGASNAVENNGSVFLDEIDKICVRDGRVGGGGWGEGVQRDLLPLIEGTTVSTKHGTVKTDPILFIASGAFHIAKPSDLLPELQGRLPIRVELEALTRDDMRRILTEPEASLIKQYVALLQTEGVTLDITDGAIDALADVAVAVNSSVENIGARRLQTVMERVLDDISFAAPDRHGETIRVDADYVQKHVGDLAKNADLSRFIL